MKQLFAIAIFIFFSIKLQAQSFAINTDGSTANASALLDVKSTDKGILVPRMSKAQKNSIASPATGLMIFQNAPDSTGFYYYNGSSWLWLATASNVTGWSTTGNAATDTSVNFIGTTTNMPLRFKVNNNWAGQLDHNLGNFFIGTNAGKAASTGIVNTGFGSGTLTSNTSGNFNTAIGGGALFSNTTATQNTAMGTSALSSHKTGDDNVAAGALAMWQDTTSTKSVAIGSSSMFESRNATGNVAIGYTALFQNKKGGLKTAVGYQALQADTSLSPNVAIGSNSLLSNVSGKSLVAIGANALASNTVSNNVAIGTAALELNAVSSNNTAVGDSSLRNNVLNDNTAIGAAALYSNTFGSFGTAAGSNALRSNTTGFGNTAIGGNSLYSNTSGNSNIGIGTAALYFHKTGSSNIAIGSNALYNDTTGTNNVAIGNLSMQSSASMDNSVAVGNSALSSNKNGISLVAIGALALQNDTSGNYNVAVGAAALQANKNGQHNIAIGYSAGGSNTTGTQNTIIGSNSDVASNNLINATAIGYKAYAAQDNSLVLGSINGLNTATSSVNVGVGTNTPDARMHIVRNGASGGTYQSESGLILENSSIFTMQFSTPNASPALIRSGNAATAQRSGITFEADSSITFNSGGSLSRMYINNTGNLGINESTPDARLHIRDNGSSGGSFISNSSLIIEDNTTSYIQLSHPNASGTGIFSGNASTTSRSGITFNADSSVNIRTGGNNNRLTVDNAGLVGVRTTVPISYLDVNGSTGNAISTGAGLTITLDEFDHTHIIPPTILSVTVSLPTASTSTRREYVIVNQDNTIHTISSYLDFTGTAVTTIPANSSITLQSNGTNWYRIR